MTGVDHAIIVGARGSLTSLLDGNVDLGVFRRELNDGMGAKYGFLSSTNLVWHAIPELTDVSLSLIADTTPTPVNDSIISKNLRVARNPNFQPILISRNHGKVGHHRLHHHHGRRQSQKGLHLRLGP